MRTVILAVRVLTDDPRPEAGPRIEMEVRRSLRLWLGPERVYVELAQPVEVPANVWGGVA